MPRSCRRFVTIGVSTVLVGVVQASAAAAERVAVLPLQVEGELRADWEPKFEAAIARGLVQSGLEVIEPPAVTKATGGVGTCANAKCYRFVASAVDARYVVVGKLKVEERNYEIGLDVIDGNDGSLAASSSESCQVCGVNEVEELVSKQAVALREKVNALSLEPAIVAITSEPNRVEVFIDGDKVGVTPLEHQLEAGPHEATARKRGYVDQTRKIHAVQGVREALRFELIPRSDDRVDVARKDWKVPAGWALLGVGTAALAAGVTFLVLDERPYKARCSGADVDALGNCRQRYNTMIHGAAFTATGGALLVTGVAMLIASRVQRGKRTADTRRRQRALSLLGGRF
jgi:hypothetical protein